MSERKPIPKDSELPLPSPRSPRALDDKILAYAKAKAPHRKAWLRHPWVAGMVTASVVAVAVFITEPEQTLPTLQQAPVPRPAEIDFMELTPAKKEAEPRAMRAAPMKSMKERDSYLQSDADNTAGAALADKAAPAAVADEEGRGQVPRDELRHCARMLQAGQEEQARSAYQQLRGDCANCVLPETLEEAITRYLQDY